MLRPRSLYRSFLLFSAFLCFVTAIQAQQIESRANNRGGIKIMASGQCVQLQFDDKNLSTAGAAGAIISLWIPNDTASIGKTVGIFNGTLSSADEQAFRPIKRRYEDGDVYLPNNGFAQTDSLGKYAFRIPLFPFGNPQNPQDFMFLRAAMSNPKSKALTFLIVATHSNGTKAQRWINLHDYVNFSKLSETNSFDITLPTLTLVNEIIPMEAAIIKVQAVTVKGDTTEMNAGSFKVNPDATAEDLVTKMPGVTSSNGQVQAQGEQVKKVLVDGKPFFGDDPNAALKNLPADVVNKIQIYDGKSEQSLFSGIDDGNTVKTMNIVTKSQFRNGLFGRGFAGYGRAIETSSESDINKYKGGITINSFKGNRRLSFLSQTNNINEQNFSFEDLVGGMGGGNRGGNSGGGGGMGRMGMGGMGSAANLLTGNQSGITTTRAIGLNYSDQWSKSTEVSGSYFFNKTINNNDYNTNRTYITGDPATSLQLGYLDTNRNNTNNNSHRFNARFTIKLDSSNSLIIDSRASLQQNAVLNPLHAITFNGSGLTISNLSNLNNTETTGIRSNLSVLWRHAYPKKGRTLSVEANPGINGQSGYTLLQNTNTWMGVDTKRDQKTSIDKLNQTFSGNLTFTESLDSNHYLAATIATNINQNNTDRLANLYDALSGQYILLDTLFSSKFVNGYNSNKMGVSYRYQTYKWNVTASLDAQIAQLNGSLSLPKSAELQRQFTSLLPGIQARYNMGSKKNLRLNYSTSNNAPSIDQLQPVTNNNNVMQLSTGNPLLVQDYQHSFFMRFFSVTPETGRNQFFMINAQFSNNYISSKTILGQSTPLWIQLNNTTLAGNNGAVDGSYSLNDSIFLSPGAQITLPINMNGYYNLRMFGSWGKTIKKLNINSNAGITVSHIPSMIQLGNNLAKTNMATNPSANAGLVLSSNISEKIDFNMSGNASYSQVINSIQLGNNQTYMSYNARAAMNFMPNKKWVLNSDVTYQAFSGLSNSFNQSYYLWNAGLGYKFLKNNAGELRITGYDLLNQNRSIQRNVTQTYFEDVKTKVLNRYVMLTFTYKLRKFNGKGEDGKDMKMMFPGGMPPAGMPMHGMPGMGGPGR